MYEHLNNSAGDFLRFKAALSQANNQNRRERRTGLRVFLIYAAIVATISLVAFSFSLGQANAQVVEPEPPPCYGKGLVAEVKPILSTDRHEAETMLITRNAEKIGFRVGLPASVVLPFLKSEEVDESIGEEEVVDTTGFRSKEISASSGVGEVQCDGEKFEYKSSFINVYRFCSKYWDNFGGIRECSVALFYDRFSNEQYENYTEGLRKKRFLFDGVSVRVASRRFGEVVFTKLAENPDVDGDEPIVMDNVSKISQGSDRLREHTTHTITRASTTFNHGPEFTSEPWTEIHEGTVEFDSEGFPPYRPGSGKG